MSNTTLRTGAAAGAAIVLALAALAGPAAGDGGTDRTVRAAAAGEPVIIGSVDDATVGGARLALQELGEQVVARAAVAEQVRGLQAVAAAVEAREQARQAAAAAAAAAEAEEQARLAAAAAAEAEEARRAEEARQAEERRAAAAAAAAPAPAGSLEAIIQRHFGDAAPEAIRIARCESSMDPNARSATNDHGLFQINAVHRGQFEAVTGAPWSSVYDPELNTAYARYLYGQQGWSPWTCA